MMMASDYWKHTRCGHYSTRSAIGNGSETDIDDLCHACRTARVGQTIRFVRFGTFPANGRSTNHRDRTAEEGVSVYEVVRGKADLVGWHFDFTGRAAYRGTGVIVGWGSDGEPLVRVESARRVSPKEIKALVSGA